jgi:hypothetical protein
MVRTFAALIAVSPLVMLAGCGDRNGASQQATPQPGTSQTDAAERGILLLNEKEATDAIVRLGGHVYPSSGEVDFGWTKVTDSALRYVESFPEVQSLSLIDTQVTDAGLMHVKRLKHLQNLNLYGTKVSDDGLKNLSSLSQLLHLNLNNTRVTDAGLAHLKGLVALQTLGIINTEVTDAGLEHLKGLNQLKDLDLKGTKITDAGLEQLKGLKQLESLDLGNTKVTDVGLQSVNTLPRLGRLYVDKTRVTAEAVKRLKQTHPDLIYSPAMDLSGWKPGMPIPVYITPFYSSDGPQISVGAYSKKLAEANATTISRVAAEMKREWATLPVEAMYVAAIRHYDLGRKDDAVYWFYSAQYRARLFKSILSDDNANSIGASAFEAVSAHGAFHELAGEYINGYGFGNLDKLKATIKTVQSENEKALPSFISIYPTVNFIPAGSWGDKNKEIAAGLSKLLGFIETQAEEINAQRKQNGIEGKY